MLTNGNMSPPNEGGEKSTQRKILEGLGVAVATVVFVGGSVFAGIKGPDPVKIMRDQEKKAELERAHALLPNCAPAGTRVTFEGANK